METQFVDLILPLPLPKMYTYRVPRVLEALVKPGIRVIVQFGNTRMYSALVYKVHETPPKHYEAKYIDQVLDSEPIVTNLQLRLWQWISEYYLCSLGEVMNAAIPTGLKINSETLFTMHPDYEGTGEELTDSEFMVLEAMRTAGQISAKDIEKILDRKVVYPLVKSLIGKRIMIANEELKVAYRPKMIPYVGLNQAYTDESAMRKLFEELDKAPAQLRALMSWIHWSIKKESGLVNKSLMTNDQGVSPAAIKALCDKGIFTLENLEQSRLGKWHGKLAEPERLSDHQERALQELKQEFEHHNTVLLHGVTSSGKTEVYIRLIAETLARGEQALYLLPEIALTTQIISRLRRYFGDKIVVYHSRYNASERVEVWYRVLGSEGGTTQPLLVLGARSALFVPFSKLGLIIVDEEHENSYKQYDPSPRYSARDTAIVMAAMHGAKVVLGSATPAIESMWLAGEKKYGLVKLDKRFGDVNLPEVLVADVKEELRKKLMKSHFSSLLLEQMDHALKLKEQVILFQNRRGFAPYQQCERCAFIPSCNRCDVSLTYHKSSGELRCHYCGYKERATGKCKACNATEMKLQGFGTEKIEEELALLFPEARVQRMDLDTTRTRTAYEDIIRDFEERKIDILVGTQMVTKGLDFDNVSLVGIMNADNMLYFPDFRAFERSFQLMSQVAGRAGRRSKRGKVVIQTMNPYHNIILDVVAHNYQSMYESELLQRRNFEYPPFYRLIAISIRHKQKESAAHAAKALAAVLGKQFGKRVLGPQVPSVERIRDWYYMNLLIKIEREASVRAAKTIITEAVEALILSDDGKGIKVAIDVDPM